MNVLSLIDTRNYDIFHSEIHNLFLKILMQLKYLSLEFIDEKNQSPHTWLECIFFICSLKSRE